MYPWGSRRRGVSRQLEGFFRGASSALWSGGAYRDSSALDTGERTADGGDWCDITVAARLKDQQRTVPVPEVQETREVKDARDQENTAAETSTIKHIDVFARIDRNRPGEPKSGARASNRCDGLSVRLTPICIDGDGSKAPGKT